MPELAVLKTVGFTDALVAWLMLGEALLLCGLGAVLGVLAAVGVAFLVGPQLEDFFGVFKVSWPVMASALGISLLLGLAVGAVPSLSARRLSIVDALRSRRN